MPRPSLQSQSINVDEIKEIFNNEIQTLNESQVKITQTIRQLETSINNLSILIVEQNKNYNDTLNTMMQKLADRDEEIELIRTENHKLKDDVEIALSKIELNRSPSSTISPSPRSLSRISPKLKK